MVKAANRNEPAHLVVDLVLDRAPVMLIGGGAEALAKLRLLRAAGVAVRLFAGDAPMPALAAAAAADDGVTVIPRLPSAGDFSGARLAIIALQDPGLAAQTAAAARAAGVLVNVVDRQELCDVRLPALVLRPPVQVGISTGGRVPQLAVALRRRIEAALPAGLGALARRMARLRARWRAAGRSSKSVRLALAARLERALGGEARLAPAAGEVVLAGAGPGAVDWLTIETARLLSLADVIIHDGLVSPEVLGLARRDAQIIDAARRAGSDRRKALADTTSLMIAHARRGRLVLRLKGGDPAVFAHTMEEVAALRRAGVRFRIVPGVTAASAAAASAGIALTARGSAEAVSFVTAVKAKAQAADLKGLARADRTLVVYMGVKEAARWAEGLAREGLAPDTPVLIAERIGWPGERRIVTDLARLAETVRAETVESPALFILGAPAAAAAATGELAVAAVQAAGGGA